MTTFERFLADTTNIEDASLRQPWQCELAASESCGNRLIRIPTGFGKTLGVLSAWVWHRVCRRSDAWPRRLIWCLPMRVLVEQTEKEVKAALERLGLLCGDSDKHEGKVGVHLLMGGADAGQWHLHPERDAVLIGTQDMLLSRAMNRGYASPRARWPMEFGLLNQDALWVMDEVQLMDVGLATSAQLQAFRAEDQDADKTVRPCFTWWMSATLQRHWLKCSPDAEIFTDELNERMHRIESSDRKGKLWDEVAKHIDIIPYLNERKLAEDISGRHRKGGCGGSGPTLALLNTVERAVAVWKILQADKALKRNDTDIRLVHSRFRPHERISWSSEFLKRDACAPGTNRIIVSTQVIEAGVDISAALLFTELAPWTSLVQRFGRCARWGGKAEIVIADFEHDSDGKALPYALDEIKAAKDACQRLPNTDAAPVHLEDFEEDHQDLLPRLYPYQPKHLLLRHELDELFDTTPDLSGADIDISRFIRSGEERDVQVFWACVADKADPPSDLKPTRDELCGVPFIRARKWLCGSSKSEKLKPGVNAWVWDWLERRWRQAGGSDLHPGQTVLVDSGVGGYHPERGWDPNCKDAVKPVPTDKEIHRAARPCWKRNGDGWLPSERQVRTLPPEDHADAAEEDESLSFAAGWQTIASHGLAVGKETARIAALVAPAHARLLHLAGRWHDLGKAHPAFQGCLQADDRPKRDDLAKAPDRAWPCSLNNMYRGDAGDQRRGFRHELASTLGLFAVLQRHEPHHQALLGPWTDWLSAMGERSDQPPNDASSTKPTAIEQEILDLNADEFDLLAYLVCAHHGKVRMTWHASPADQKANDQRLRIRGVRNGDILPSLPLANAEGDMHRLPAAALDLAPSETGLSARTGRSWTERVLNLLDRLGPFMLAWLEALLRAADQRASKQQTQDILLQDQEKNDAGLTVDGSCQTLAQPAGGGAATPPPRSDSPTCRQFHGYGGRTGGRELDPGTTRPLFSATRYIETSVGVLSHQNFASLLAEQVGKIEIAISNQRFADLPIETLLLELHRHVCEDLIPNIAGRWRLKDVRVGDHKPPPHWRVPMLMRNYAADLQVRMDSLDENSEQQLIDTLVFAEGHLLHVHPFEDFNGRVSRLLLIELLYRLKLPAIDPAASSPEQTQRYFAALRAYDRRDTRPLAAIWRQRVLQDGLQ